MVSLIGNISAMRQIITFLLFLSVSVAYSQSKIDSLKTVLETTSSDPVKIKSLLALYNEYQFSNIENAQKTALEAIKVSKKVSDNYLLAKSYSVYGEFLNSRSEYDSSIVYYNKSMAIAEAHTYNDVLSESLIQLADNYLRKGNYMNAIQFQEKNIELCAKLKNESGLARSYRGLGIVYMAKNDLSKSMEYFTDAHKINSKLGNKIELGMTMANMGMNFTRVNNIEKGELYLMKADSILSDANYAPGVAFVKMRLGIVAHSKGDYEKAKTLFEKSLASFKKQGNLDRMGNNYYLLGFVAWRQNKFSEALSYFRRNFEVTEISKDSIEMSLAVKAMGDSYIMLGDMNEAKSKYLQALHIATKAKYGLYMMDAYEALANLYEEEGDFKKAYENERLYGVVKDSMFTKERREYANEIEAKYQNEQKAKENALLAKDNDLQALLLTQRINERNVLIAFSLVALILGLLLYNQFRVKQKANKKLQDLDRLKSNFFTNISHEFRTPLTLIKGPIEQLEQNPEERLSTENVKMIRRNANRLLKLVNQLLELSKSDEGSLKLEPTEGDIFKCLRGITSSFNSHAAQRQIDYRVSIPQTVLWTAFDRDKVEKIVYNLMSNAFKFSEDSAVIRCDVQFNSPNLSIEVSDSGRGIPKEQIPLIFDRFYQTDHNYSKGYEGSGIGLSIAKAYVDLMDGTITVSSEVNKGTYFNVQVSLQEIMTRTTPINVDALIPSEKLQKKPFQLSEIDKRNLPEILLIEDNEDMRHFIKAQLIATYKIKEAVNGQAGLSEAIANPPDLIITDLMMPKMDGIELCKNLKTTLATSHVPVIMLTAKAGLDNKLEGLETGADDYLTKPFNAIELSVRVKNLIEQRRKLRELFAQQDLQIDPKNIAVTSLDQKFLHDVLSLLEKEHSNSDFGVPQMQDALAMSKTQLHRKLKSLTNEAPGELLRNFRLKRAAQLLLKDADSVTQIAYSVGFNNLSYFAKCFKEVYGVSPSAYSVQVSN